MRSKFCPLCDVSMGSIPIPISFLPVPLPPLEWYRNIRAVRSLRGTSSPLLTGVGYLCPEKRIRVPVDPNETYSSENVVLEDYNPLFNNEDYWVFCFHEACWQLLLLQSGSTENSSQLANELFRMLLSSSIDSLGHHSLLQETGGARQFIKKYADPVSDCHNTPWSFIHANPLVPVECADLPRQNNSFVYRRSSPSKELYQNGSLGKDIFARLPFEIIHQILIQLPSTAVPNIRLASKVFAELSTLDQLPQSFWRSRFFGGQDMSFIPVAALGAAPDWHYRYFQIKLALVEDGAYLSLKNRRRIWLANSQTTRIIRLLRRTGGLQGRQVSNLPSSSNYQDVAKGRVVTADVNGDRNMDLPRLHRRGCRELESKDFFLPDSRESEGYSLGISVVHLSGQAYISGFRIINNRQESKSCTGLIVPEEESVLEFNAGDAISFVEVAVIPTGIVGLKFTIGGRLSRVYDCIGNQSHESISFTRLVPQEDKLICGFSLGFDACKIVKIGLLERKSLDTEATSSTVPDRKQENFVDGNLWKPHIPCNVRDRFEMTPLNQSCQTYQPLFNMDFGGTRGQKLNSLTQITAFMNDRINSCFMGLEFKYCDGSLLLYGRRVGAQATMLLNGPGGERINQIMVESSEVHDRGVQSLSFSTNFRNVFVFEFENKGSNDQRLLNTYQANENGTIVGFVAAEGSRTGSFQSFGILTCQVDKVLSLPTPDVGINTAPMNKNEHLQVKANNIDVGVHLLQSTLGTLNTFAGLHDIQCVRFSEVPGDLSNRPSAISGLWIDYYDSTKSSIVGQWGQETTVLNLDRAERLTGITFWLDCKLTSGEGRAKLGHVVGVRLVTSSLRSMTVGVVSSDNLVKLNYRENRFEKLERIRWSYSVLHDHPRVITSLSSVFRTPLFQPQINASWVVKEIMPWQDQRISGQLDRLVSIQVHYDAEEIKGISFTYTSRAVLQLGVSETDYTSTKTFAEREELVRLDIGFKHMGGLGDIIFHTKIHTPGTPQTHELENIVPTIRWSVQKPGSDLCIYLVYDEFHVTGRLWTKDLEIIDDRCVYSCPPGAKFAGFWGRGSWKTLKDFGVFYVKEEEA